VWEGTIKFDLAVNYANRARTANADDVAEAVKVALADAGYPLGNGASIAGPVKSVKATPKDRRRLDARRRLALTEEFTIEVVALAPLLPAISKLVRELGFLKEVRQALYDGGATSIVNEDPAEDNAKDLAASELGGAYSADDVTVTVTPVKNDDTTMTMTVNVAAKPDAQGAANKLSAVDPAKLKDALQPAEVVGPATATVNPDGTVSWSFRVNEASLNPPVRAGDVSYPSGSGSLQDASPAPSPPPGAAAAASPPPPSSGDGGTNPGVIPDDEGSAQTKKDESLNGGIIFLIILLVLCFLCPLFCCCFARGRYGAGKERLFFKFKFSHSNPTFPAFYIPYEDREKMRAELYSKGSEKQDAPVLDQEHI